MRRMVMGAMVLGLVCCWVGPAAAQDSNAAKATRKKLQQKLSLDLKDLETSKVFAEINREIDQELRFRIDNASGVSNNTKLTYKVKNVTVEKVLNDLSDKYAFGWYVVSNESNNKVDGTVVIRRVEKGKERGYEVGKEPKKDASLRRPLPNVIQNVPHLTPLLVGSQLFMLGRMD